MKSVKAIFIGSLSIFIAILCLQLIFIFVAVAYNALAKDYPFLNDIAFSFRYIVGIPVFVATMFIGGYITAYVASTNTDVVALKRTILHCMIVGSITTIGMIYPTLETAALTITGVVIFVLALVGTTAGGLYWRRNRLSASSTGRINTLFSPFQQVR